VSINKREILHQLVKKELWENLSSKEFRLYLLLVAVTDKKGGRGKLNLKEVNNYLELDRDELKKAMYNLQKLNLIKVESLEEKNVQFRLLSSDQSGQIKR